IGGLRSCAQVRKPLQSAEAWHEEILAAAKHVERFDPVNASSDRLLRDRESRPFLLPPDDRITLAADPDEVAIVDPLLLQELYGGHRPGADEQENGAARHLIIRFGQRVWIVRLSIRRAAPDEAMDVDIGQALKRCVPRIHAPDMASKRCLPAA